MRHTSLSKLFALPLLFACSLACSDDGSDDPGMNGGMVTTTMPGATVPGNGAGAAGSPWAGRSFILTIPEANWYEPRGLGEEIGPFVPSFLISVDSVAGNVMNVTMSTANHSAAQEMCNVTTVTMSMPVAYPGMQIGPVDFPMHVKHVNEAGLQVNTTIRQLTITNVLPGAAPAEEGELTAIMDMRDLYPMFTLLSDNPTPEDVCGALEGGLGAPCTPCPHDNANFCLFIQAVALGATDFAGGITPVAPGTTGAQCVGANEMAAAAPVQ